MAWYAGFVISFSVGVGLSLGLYVRLVRMLFQREDNLNEWEAELCRREDELVERACQLDMQYSDSMEDEDDT